MRLFAIAAFIGILCAGLCHAAEPVPFKLDIPPAERQKPYYPADNIAPEVTPPPFMWVPAGKNLTYTLQISASDQFPAEQTRTFADLKRCVYVPRQPLPAGRWFWRYGVQTPQGTLYSRARAFTIPETARPFPFPDFEQAIQQVPTSRPHLFFTGDRLQRIRAAAKGELKDAIERLLQSCERSIGEDLVPEPGYQPKDPAERGPWAVNVMRTTRPPMDAMERCALAYLITGEKRFGLEAKRRLLHFFSWDPEGPTSFFAYDEPPMWLMMRGSRAYDWTYDLFTPQERARIEPNMKARARQFLKRLESMPFESSPYESHAGRLPGFLGECAISFIHDWPEARQWLEYATLLYYTSYPAWGGDDGGWQEGPSYWSAYMSFALHYVVALRHAAGIDLMQKPFFRNTPYYALYTATPYHEHLPFGDNQHGKPSGGLGAVMYAFSTLTQSPHFRWYADAIGYRPGSDLLSLATYDPALKSRSPIELPQARFFPAVGLASLHTALGEKERDISFLLRSSPFGSASHGHADQNAFVLEAFGKGLAIATGYYPWYGSPHHHNWTRATKAVNSILVNNQGQTRRSFSAAGRIVAFQHGENYDYIEAEAAPAYGGQLERFRRHVVHVRPFNIFVIYDDLIATKPSTFQWLLHSYNQMRIDEKDRVVRIVRDPAAMDVRLMLPRDLKITQTDRYDPEPEDTKGRWQNTWHLTASTIEPRTHAQFLTVLFPHHIDRSESRPATIEFAQGNGAVGVWIRGGGDLPPTWDRLVAFRTDPTAKTITCRFATTDARVFACGGLSRGQPHLLIDGEQLEIDTTNRR